MIIDLLFGLFLCFIAYMAFAFVCMSYLWICYKCGVDVGSYAKLFKKDDPIND